LSYFGIHYQDDGCFCCPDFSFSWNCGQALQSVMAVFGSLLPNLKEVYYVCDALKELIDKPERLQSMTFFPHMRITV